MKKIILTSLATLAAAGLSAQVVEDWQFGDADSTALSSASNSGPGTASWAGSGTDPLVQSGQLDIAVNSNGTFYADIADISTGQYQIDVTGVTWGNMSGGLDDFFSFGLTDANDSTNARSFSTNGSGLRDKGILVLGNENNSGGVDAKGFTHFGSDTGIVNDLFTDFTGTWDFRIDWDATNKTVDFSYQRNSGGYTVIGSQLSYADTDAASFLFLDFEMNDSTGTDSAQLGAFTLTAVPEPSTYALLAGCFALASVMIRRRK